MFNDVNFPVNTAREQVFSQDSPATLQGGFGGNFSARYSTLGNLNFLGSIELLNTTANDVLSKGKIKAEHSHLGNVKARTHVKLIDSSASDVQSNRRVTVIGTDEVLSRISSIAAHYDICLDRASIEGQTQSDWGKVTANRSNLGSVKANSNISFVDSSAKDIVSISGNVAIQGTTDVPPNISSIQARNDVTVDRASIEGLVKSKWGKVSAQRSNLDNVKACYLISLLDSSAKDLISKWGKVTVQGTSDVQSTISNIHAKDNVIVDRVSIEGHVQSVSGQVSATRSSLGSVSAESHIELMDSSATDLNSLCGSVTVRQTDGTKRSVSHITAQNKVVAENCKIDHITLFVEQNLGAFLDLTNTVVSEKIVIKMLPTLSQKIHVTIKPSVWPFGGSEREVSVNYSKDFSLLIKGTSMPKNIAFEGFDADEITTEKTSDGILVKGKKK